jgi:hypothetical protein
LNRQDYAAARSEIGLCTREFIRITRNKRNVAALHADLSRKHEPKSARPACDKRNLVAQRVARRSNDAQNQPYDNEESACQQQNARIHFGKLQSSTGTFAASCYEEQAGSLCFRIGKLETCRPRQPRMAIFHVSG